MRCVDSPATMPQTVAGESVTARVVPEPKAWEEGSKESMIAAAMMAAREVLIEEEEGGGFFI